MASRLGGHLENATQVSVIFTWNQNKVLARNFEFWSLGWLAILLFCL